MSNEQPGGGVDNVTAEADDIEVDVTETAPADEAAAAEPAGGDERLAYRGVFQRMLIRPEIGAVIGAIGIWTFFWAVAERFGNYGGMSNILDIASTLGIMSVAVAMLMIGGEFDLSSGAATGALAILTILLVRDVTGDMGGASLSLWVALPLSFAAAMLLGWFNGAMVERTSLPSFIVTLGSFFILRGMKSGFGKLIVDQVQVGKLDDLKITAEETGVSDRGYEFFNKVFSAEWQRLDHLWEGRDAVYTASILAGLTLLIVAVYEQNFAEKSKKNPIGALLLIAGIVGGIAGVLTLHNTDGSSGDLLGAAIIGGSMLAGFFGLALWRYERHSSRGSGGFGGPVIRSLGVGLVLVAAAVFFARWLDSTSEETIFLLVTEQGLRAILFCGLVAAGIVYLAIAASRAGRSSPVSKSIILLITAAVLAGLAFFIQSESTSRKFRAEFFSVLLAIAAVVAVWAVVSMFFANRREVDLVAERRGAWLNWAGLALLALGIVVRLIFTNEAEVAAGIPPAKFTVRILWFLGFTAVCSWVLARTKFGSWTFAVGGNKQAARQVGVPAARTKTQLFMLVSGAAWLVGCLLAFNINSIQAGTGNGLEFEYIIAAVVGGTMLTGGYGSTIGAAIGAMIMAMAIPGISFARWNTDWRFVFLGGILLLAVIANNFIKTKAEGART